MKADVSRVQRRAGRKAVQRKKAQGQTRTAARRARRTVQG